MRSQAGPAGPPRRCACDSCLMRTKLPEQGCQHVNRAVCVQIGGWVNAFCWEMGVAAPSWERFPPGSWRAGCREAVLHGSSEVRSGCVV